MPTRHRHEGVGDVSLIVRDAKPRCEWLRTASGLPHFTIVPEAAACWIGVRHCK